MEIASDPLASRLCGWLPIDLKGAPLFAGAEDPSRMNVIRPKIEEVRKRWYRLEDYDALKDNLRRIIKQDRHPQELLEKTQSLLVDFRGWRDYNSANADAPPLSFEQDYTAIELYCSDIGYKFMFGLINQVLRKKDLDDSQMLGAVTLVEFLTIDLYNYRLANIGNPLYHDFQGIVHRGMSVTPEELSSFQAAATGPPFQRNFSVPLAFASCSTDEGKIQEFLKSNPEKDRCQLHWVIHVHSANPRLMARYQHKYPDSIVTSLCAMPIATVSEFAEKEILLRGAFFHIVRMTTEQVGDNTVHKLEMVMLNTNRDHGSELAENKNDKEEQRRYLTKIIQATKFEICASLAQEYGLSGDAQIYQEEVKRIVDDLDTHDIGALDPSNSSLTDSPSAPALTWLGASLKSAFPEHYVKRRDMLSSAAYKGEWEKVMKIIHDDYDFQMCDWCNIPRLYGWRSNI
jgi:hypothetical protein